LSSLAAELVDPLGEEIEMLLFFLRVLREFFLDRLAGDSGRRRRSTRTTCPTCS